MTHLAPSTLSISTFLLMFLAGGASYADPLTPPSTPTTTGTTLPPGETTTAQRSSDANVSAALAQATKASQAAREASDSANAAADEVANVRSGKLISSGITAGIAGVAHIPLGNAISTTAVGSMPYVMAHPFYWQSTQAQNTYCASNWALGGDEAAASQAAYAIAKKKGERSFQSVENALRPYVGTPTKDDPKKIAPELESHITNEYISNSSDHKAVATSVVARTLAWLRVKAAGSPEANEWLAHERASIVELIATLTWNHVWPANCLTRKLGVWVGLPITYSTATEFGNGEGTDARGKREVKPTIAFGVGFSPNAYLSILAGFSINTVERAANPAAGAPAGDVSAATFVAGVGGNLDVLTLLRP